MKKIKACTSFLLAIVMCLTLTITSFAANVEKSNYQAPLPTETISGYIVDGSGNEVRIYGRLVEIEEIQSRIIGNEMSATYEFEVMASDITHNDQVSGTDNSGYMRGYLTINYVTTDNSMALLKSVTASWEDPNTSDGTRVSDTGTIVINCTSLLTLLHPQTKTVNINSGGRVYTGFTEYVPTAESIFGARLTVDLNQGSRVWQLVLECYPFD